MQVLLIVFALVLVLPVLLFGLYSALVIMHGIINFPECPDAHRDLLKDIERAKAALSARGFSAALD